MMPHHGRYQQKPTHCRRLNEQNIAMLLGYHVRSLTDGNHNG